MFDWLKNSEIKRLRSKIRGYEIYVNHLAVIEDELDETLVVTDRLVDEIEQYVGRGNYLPNDIMRWVKNYRKL